VSTFEASKLRWEELDQEPHAGMVRLHRALLTLRQGHEALRGANEGPVTSEAIDDDTLLLVRGSATMMMAVVVRLRGAGTCELPAFGDLWTACPWRVLLTTEAPDFTVDPTPPDVDLSGPAPVLRFRRPSAVVLARAALSE
jgi:hypothetical protein